MCSITDNQLRTLACVIWKGNTRMAYIEEAIQM